MENEILRRLDLIEEKQKKIDETLDLIIEYIDKNVSKKSNIYYTDGPIMAYPHLEKLINEKEH